MSYRFSAYKRKSNFLYVFILTMLIMAVVGIVVAVVVFKNDDNDDEIKIESKRWQLTYAANGYTLGDELLTQNDASVGYKFKFLPENFTDNSFLRFKVNYTTSSSASPNLKHYLNNMFQNLTFNSTENYGFKYQKDGFYYLTDKDNKPAQLSYIKSYYFGEFEVINSSNIIVPENDITLLSGDFNKALSFDLEFEAISNSHYEQNKNLTSFENIHNYFLNMNSGDYLPIMVKDGVLTNYVTQMKKDNSGNEIENTNIEFTLSSTYKLGEIFEDGSYEVLSGDDLYIYSISDNAFNDKNYVKINLASLEYVESVGNYAFYHCRQLKGNLNLNACKQIGNYAFNGCRSLTSNVNLENCITIGNFAFVDTGIKGTLNFNRAESIGQNAFTNCIEITALNFNNTNKTTLNIHCFNGLSKITSLNLTNIANLAGADFANCTNLQTVVLPNHITVIEMSCFSGCSKLKNINLNNIKTFENSALAGCTSLSGIISLPNTNIIKSYAFDNCTGITKFQIKSTCTKNNNWNRNCTATIEYL